ncbi:hypothetical protein AKJ41_01335 [candidate division MSBL1 archaeon SCGC-AAA259O05]|uniref:HTH asnC-type domain-containing protein n=1 Tax=candidate division MSBL1 archaeon SCGC-AAA259O05 TaxID=1698271 RepID=A0A133V4Y7_9EURY|nr:hypothetical protein AKJ41_01335 [candidate division MSBL1 archaeon SCGC-AAA259O05]
MFIEKLDEVDRKILKMLVEDGRAKLSEMAEEVELSSSGLRKRVKTLEEEGVIEGYTANC